MPPATAGSDYTKQIQPLTTTFASLTADWSAAKPLYSAQQGQFQLWLSWRHQQAPGAQLRAVQTSAAPWTGPGTAAWAEQPDENWLENRNQFQAQKMSDHAASRQLKIITISAQSESKIFWKQSFFFVK